MYLTGKKRKRLLWQREEFSKLNIVGIPVDYNNYIKPESS